MTDRQIIDVNLATCEVALSEACSEVVSRTFHIDRLTSQERAGLKDEFFERWFPTTQWKSEPVNAIECELLDFHRAIESRKAPEVTGEQGREAIDVADRILSAIAGRTSVAHRRVA
jgi:predicted dehydrogenase